MPIDPREHRDGERPRPRSPQGHIGEHLQQAPNHQKFSRYRAVRNAAAAAQTPVTIPAEDHAAQVKRSMSRYNKRRPTDPPGHMPAMPKLLASSHPDQATANIGVKESTPKSAGVLYKNAAQEEAYRKLTGSAIHTKSPDSTNERDGVLNSEEQQISGGRKKAEEHSHPPSRYRNNPRSAAHPRRAVTDPIPQAPLVKPRSATTPQMVDTAAVASTSPPAVRQTSGEMVGSPEQLQPSVPIQTHTSNAAQRPILHGTNAEAPNPPAGFDAPMSAVNAGTRVVSVQSGSVRLHLDVEPTTTPANLLRLAAAELPDAFDPSTSLLAESFSYLGLERPLRHYEHVRDVLNSWDRDTQNTLQVLNGADLMSEGVALHVQDAPRRQPGDTSVHVHYSHKPGSWEKRWITLRSDGQVYVAKSAEAKAAEQRNICHMSDFDVYMPTARQLKKLRPPRKYCIAIKSQQKSIMFESTVNFVHFFCVKDKELAQQWYQAAQRWRSWYLVNKMGLGEGGSVATFVPDPARNASTHAAPAAAVRSPTDPAQAQPLNRHGGPPVSFPRKLTKEAPKGRLSIIQKPPPQAEPDPFAATGLLGRTYSQKQRQAQLAAQRSGPSVAWPGPMGAPRPAEPVDEPFFYPEAPPAGGLARNRSTRTTRSHGSAPHRAMSGPDAPPVPPLQHVSRSSGSGGWEDEAAAFSAGASGGGGLIEGARNVDPTLTRALQAGAADAPGGMLARIGSVRRSGTVKKPGEPLVALGQDSAFVPGSLLAGVERYQAEHEPPVEEGTFRLRNGRVLDTKVQREVVERVGEGVR